MLKLTTKTEISIPNRELILKNPYWRRNTQVFNFDLLFLSMLSMFFLNCKNI